MAILTDLDVEEVTLCANPAVPKAKFLRVRKSLDGPDQHGFTCFGKVQKVDDVHKIVYGYCLVPDETDKQGDIISVLEVEKAAHSFLNRLAFRSQKGTGTGSEHEVFDGVGYPVESFIDADGVFGIVGGWWLVTKVTNEKIWKAILDGEVLGYSVGGWATHKSGEDDMVLKESSESVEKAPEPIEKSVVPFQNLPLNDNEAASWSFSAADGNEILGDPPDWARYKKVHILWNPDNAEVKAGYSLPIAKLVDGSLKVFWHAVSAAMAIVNGGRGGLTGWKAEDRKGAHDHLARYYKKFDKPVPEFKSESTYLHLREEMAGIEKASKILGIDLPDEVFDTDNTEGITDILTGMAKMSGIPRTESDTNSPSAGSWISKMMSRFRKEKGEFADAVGMDAPWIASDILSVLSSTLVYSIRDTLAKERMAAEPGGEPEKPLAPAKKRIGDIIDEFKTHCMTILDLDMLSGLDQVQKAGKVLSAINLTKLQDVVARLTSVLDSATAKKEEKESMVETKTDEAKAEDQVATPLTMDVVSKLIADKVSPLQEKLDALMKVLEGSETKDASKEKGAPEDEAKSDDKLDTAINTLAGIEDAVTKTAKAFIDYRDQSEKRLDRLEALKGVKKSLDSQTIVEEKDKVVKTDDRVMAGTAFDFSTKM